VILPLHHLCASPHRLFCFCLTSHYLRNPRISHFSDLWVSSLIPPSPEAIPPPRCPQCRSHSDFPISCPTPALGLLGPHHPHSHLPIDFPIIPPPTPPTLRHPHWLCPSPARHSPPTSSVRGFPLALCYTCLHFAAYAPRELYPP
ncbi:hypothetical protein H1C71_030277, partial [Ictidomys tridecemlineatus]